ncbi:uncharacterized protein C19orf47 homolog isoform X1 [Gallus gallus]|uniref:uncharacterized protein C19orf47 homolog isoform X1 n=1 Tax=Gallus gallus TaxID=9031 RepID=UPI001F0042E3|nr:uncharacterized protein C19orf47 homolog isoform X1 [Gallus gallus]
MTSRPATCTQHFRLGPGPEGARRRDGAGEALSDGRAATSVTMATSEWIQFFRDAGIPPGPAVSYAVTFVDNRIHKHMLLDLTKELMHELGITLVGDVIAILKHAKVAYRQEMCRAATEALTPPSAPPELRRCANSAAGRMIANSLSRDPTSISITVPNHSSPPVPPKLRRVAADAAVLNPRIRHSPAAPALQRTSVFDRLGAETELSKDPPFPPQPAVGVFGRLGSAPPTSPPPSPEEDNGRPLPYAGVLKKPPPPPRDPPPAVRPPHSPHPLRGSAAPPRPPGLPRQQQPKGETPPGGGGAAASGLGGSQSAHGRRRGGQRVPQAGEEGAVTSSLGAVTSSFSAATSSLGGGAPSFGAVMSSLGALMASPGVT